MRFRFSSYAVIILCVALFMALCASVAAQNNAAQQTVPSFRSRSEMVLVPVVVHDKSGRHIPNLEKDQFVVLENGKTQKVATFEEINVTAGVLQKTKMPEGEFSNFINEGKGTPTRLVLVVLDLINSNFLDQKAGREAFLKFLSDTASTGEPIGLLTISPFGVKVIHDFTTDPKILLAALQKVKGSQPTLGASAIAPAMSSSSGLSDTFQTEIKTLQGLMDDAAAKNQDEDKNLEKDVLIRATMKGLRQIAKAAAGVPGRKSLLWITGASNFSIRDSQSQKNDVGLGWQVPWSILSLYEGVWKAFNDANTAVYPIDSRRLIVGDFIDASRGVAGGSNVGAMQAQSLMERNKTIQTITAFAEMTGGEVFINRNDLTNCFHEAVNDSASYYMLGYYLNRNANKPGWRKLQVEVKQQGARVRSRRGFLVGDPKDLIASKASDIETALGSPLEYTGLSLTAQWLKIYQNGTKKRVDFSLRIPTQAASLIDESNNNRLDLEIVGIIKAPTGEAKHEFTKPIQRNMNPQEVAELKRTGIRYTSSMELAPGEYMVRFVVRDNLTGRVGTVTAPLKL